jgi:hypothetical protein
MFEKKKKLFCYSFFVFDLSLWLKFFDCGTKHLPIMLHKVMRSVVYEQKKRLLKETDKDKLGLLRLLDEEHIRHTVSS